MSYSGRDEKENEAEQRGPEKSWLESLRMLNLTWDHKRGCVEASVASKFQRRVTAVSIVILSHEWESGSDIATLKQSFT